MKYYISDTHFHHGGIIEMCSRPFKSVEEMNKTMIDNWNYIVDKDDEVYFLGDFGLSTRQKLQDILSQLTGIKHLIVGNHDPNNRVLKLDGWSSINYYKELTEEDKETGIKHKICLFHYPIETWNRKNKGSIHLHGHNHTNKNKDDLSDRSRRLNICVELIGYTPISMGEVFNKVRGEIYSYEKGKVIQISHNGKDGKE